MSGRPKWAEAIRRFIADDVMDDQYEFPADGTDDTILERIEEAVNAILCDEYGHNVIHDQCGIPDHRYCVCCGRRIGGLTLREFDRVES